MQKIHRLPISLVAIGIGILWHMPGGAPADEPAPPRRSARTAPPTAPVGRGKVPEVGASMAGRVMAYEAGKSIAVGIPRLKTPPAEFAIRQGRTNIELLGDAKEITVGMPVTVWRDKDESTLAARIVAGTANVGSRGMGRMGSAMSGPEAPKPSVAHQPTVPGKRPEPEISALLNQLLVEEVLGNLSHEVHLAPRTNDEVFLRRITLDLIGHVPTPQAVGEFAADSKPDKRVRAVERLLADPRFGTNWGRYWRDVIMSRQAGEGGPGAAAPLEWFLTDQFNGNAGWNKTAAAFIAAAGNVYERGETALFTAQGLEPVDVASETARVFLGIQIQCAQCHDHPTDRWKREQFHEFAAFFPRVRIKRIPGGQANSELTSVDSGPESRRPGSGPTGSLEYFMPELKAPTSQGTLMTPVFFVTGQRLSTGASDAERRQSLARWLTSRQNPWFATALVNRLWAELVGEGFLEPVDDIGPDRTGVAPRTLRYLSDQFAEHDYDMKWLLQIIMATDVYQRESRMKRNATEPPFAANVPRRLRADQLMDVLADTLETEVFANAQASSRMSRARGLMQAEQFRWQFRYDPSVRREEISNSIPQVLMLMNAPVINQAVSGVRSGTFLVGLLTRVTDNEQAVVGLYLRCLGRHPNQEELAVCLDEVRTSGERAKAFENIYWTLVNCEEFRFRQ